LKKSRIGAYTVIVIGLAIVVGVFSLNPNEKKIEGYHITLADPSLYKDGIFTDSFDIQKGNYEFRFVPNGDSPKILTINLEGSSFSFSEDFQLEGTPHETGISVYYTWDYLGMKKVIIEENQKLTILINPYNNIVGPVSIDLIPLK
jgi:hypothetical protein